MTIQHSAESRKFFLSHASFSQEKRRHLGTYRYKYTIHPFSIFALQKRIIMSFVWTAAFIVVPYLGSFEATYYLSQDKPVAQSVRTIVHVIHTMLIIDIVTHFFTGYVIQQTREIVLDPRRIIKHYLRTYFWFDCIATICSSAPIFFWFLSMWPKLVIYQFHVLRWARLKTLLDNFAMSMKLLNLHTSLRICFLLLLVSILSLHWWACLLGVIPVIRHLHGIPNNNSWIISLNRERQKFALSRQAWDEESDYTIFQNYFQYILLVSCHFFGAGVGRFRTSDDVEMVILSCVVFTGFTFYVYLLARVLQLFGMVNIAEIKYEELITQASQYMVTKKFPSKLRKRIQKYYDYKFEKTFFSEHQILNSLSEHLRMEVLLYSCANLIDEVPIFKGLSRSAVGCILALLKQEIYLPEDVIMSAEENNGTLYFILYGTCGVILDSGHEAMHVDDGNHFGMTSDNKVDVLYRIIALEACEIYSLSSKDIKYCCLTYPEISAKIELLSKATLNYYHNVFSTTALEDEVIANDILAELRRGNILDHGRRREEFCNIKFT